MQGGIFQQPEKTVACLDKVSTLSYLKVRHKLKIK